MISYTTVKPINRSAADTFDVVGTNVYENQTRWEPEVVEVRPITPGPVSVGSRSVMVRRDYGRTTENENLVTEFEPDRRIAFHHPDPGLDFKISFEITPVSPESCTLEVEVQAQPQGWARIFEPILRLAMPKRGERIVQALVEVVESTPARI